MDLWVVAALTGAGYAAKYLSRDKEGLIKSARSNGGDFGLVDGFGDSSMQQRNTAIASTSGFQDDDSYNEGIQLSPHALATSRANSRAQNVLKTRRNNYQMQSLRPLDSLESCLMAQICKHYPQTPLPSPCVPALRPFVVTDGTRVISRPSFETCTAHLRDDTVSEIDHQNHAFQRLSSIREMPNRTHKALQVPPSEAALFCIGFSVGVLCSNFANKSEVVKLKDGLKQTENLVQDLKEELDMKDTLTVNELVRVDTVLPNDHDTCVANKKTTVSHLQSDSQADVDFYTENSDYHKAHEKSESMNQIEAELEAELERLELNMNSSYNLQIKSSDEVSTDMVADLIQDELKADNLASTGSSSSLSCPPEQSVSPRELSLRLHQVIESRLEARIKELERAVEKSRKRVRQLEHSEMSSSFAEHQVPVPLVMNLSGEALDAYNEAFEELSKFSGAAPAEEDRDGDDTELLIRQIVEKTRQGSSAILHAHRAMISLDI